jgi:hypothetical protein
VILPFRQPDTRLKLCPSWLPLEGEDPEAVEERTDLDRIFARSASTDLLDLFVRAVDDEEEGKKGGTLFIASTASVDRMGDVIDQSTWRLGPWRSNPVILADHAPPVVGSGTAKVADVGGGIKRLEIRVRWDDDESNPVGRLLAHQHRNGFRSAGSVGFMPGKAINRLDLSADDPRKAPEGTDRWRAGYVFSHNELLEFSSVAVPANRDAVQLSASLADIAPDDPALIERFVRESVQKDLAQLVLDAVQNDPKVRQAIRGMVWSSPAKPATLHDLFVRTP